MAKKKTSKKGNAFIEYDEEMKVKSSNGYYPTLTVNADAVPDLADKKIGEKCMIMVEGKVRSMRDDGDGATFEFEVHNIKGAPKDKPKLNSQKSANFIKRMRKY